MAFYYHITKQKTLPAHDKISYDMQKLSVQYQAAKKLHFALQVRLSDVTLPITSLSLSQTQTHTHTHTYIYIYLSSSTQQ